jgi:hypothetical protein
MSKYPPQYRIRCYYDLEKCIQTASHLSKCLSLLYLGHGRTEESDVCVKLANSLRRKIARAEKSGKFRDP